MPKIDWTLQQGSLEWYKIRSGIPTASEFDSILTPKTEKLSESRHNYAARLICERLLKWQADSLDKIQHIADGKENEPIAVARLELVHDIETQPVGFIRTDDLRFGASPDRVSAVSADMLRVGVVIEAKSPTIPKQMEYLLFGHDAAYRCQVAGQLLVAEADKAIFHSYNPRMPDYTVETGRDEPFIAKLKDALERFSDELEALEVKARSLGLYQAFEALATPLDAERADLMSAAELDEFLDGDGQAMSRGEAWMRG